MKNRIKLDSTDLTPSKVVCVGRNYVGHIKELDNSTPSEPVVFIKPNSAISNELVLKIGDEVHYEAELAFIIECGKLAGVGFGLDLTKRKVQDSLKSKGLPWERAKAFDQSAVFSEFVTVPEDISKLRLELEINGQLKQQGGCSMMLYQPKDLINEINSFMTLEDGDVLMTGTPAGVGRIHAGDEFVGKVFDAEKALLEVRWRASGLGSF